MAIVTIRYWAAAKEAAGVAEHELTAETLAGALSAAADKNGGAQLILVDGNPVGRRAADSVALRDGSVIEVLPPFAGG
jgi:molybdopterin synthase sulfur carrier subunit